MKTKKNYTKKEYRKYVKGFNSKFCREKKWLPVSFEEWKKVQPEADDVLKELKGGVNA